MFLRGRPVTYYVPETKYEGAYNNYELTKVSPAPNKKLKLDWVSFKIFKSFKIVLLTFQKSLRSTATEAKIVGPTSTNSQLVR